MDRRAFTALGIGAAAAAFLKPAFAQITSPSPENLSKALPSSDPVPAVGANLSDNPAPPSEAVTQRLFPGFSSQYIKTSGATIRVLTKGEGPPLLLLHGHPETHVTWHKIASSLAEQYSVVLPDLRGYGDSSRPSGGENHINYSFRAMALDQKEVMAQLGHKRFFMAGHDRGGRVAHRLCLDHPELVEKVVLLDIAPTLTMYNDTNKEFATKYLWWFFQIQPEPMPEHFISFDPVYYLRDHLFVQSKTPGAVTPEAMSEYIRCYCTKTAIHAVCEDYRAAAGIDLDMDRADDAAGHKIQVPVHALWGAEGTVGKLWDVIATWKVKSAGPVTGRALPCGHLLPEEQPDEVLKELRTFFSA
ncbi:alpha/beta fold hydrolase [Dyella flava]|uniref:Alpha/beta hydrolase n=1 Tax=Dyella flava TaxID=1920170 RepID=A0ABS2K1I6_9GAMM|nr:alpha/beta hydrolase [Dyella flava]MBM7124480.1 alpha/beta hydrolase [Dyella flava]GLQ51857.1 fluoroacetate dehalogenase [Dyella flava]